MNESASVFVLGSFVVACSAIVARFPHAGESMTAEVFTMEPGGKGFNLAVGARRLGVAVDGIFAVGDDVFAALAEPAFLKAGLPPEILSRRAGPTGIGIGFTDAAGETCLAVHAGANRLLSADDVRACASALEDAELVLAQFEIGDEPIEEAFKLAQEAGRLTVLNPSPFRPIQRRILERTSILVLNRVEAMAFAADLGMTMPPDAGCAEFVQLEAGLLERGPELVIVTLGADGALALPRGGAPLHQPSFRVPVVDALGAGDAFTAGLTAALVEGRSLTESLARAAACGALVVSQIGVFDALPTQDMVESFLGKAAGYSTHVDL